MFGTSCRTFSLPSLLTAERTQVSQSALISMSCSSRAVLVALHCTWSSMSIPFLSWLPPKRHLRFSLRSTEHRTINGFQTSGYTVVNTTYLICPRCKIPGLICPWTSWASVRSFSSLSRFFGAQLLFPMSYCLQTCWECSTSHHPGHE